MPDTAVAPTRYRKKPVVIEAIRISGLNLEAVEAFVGGDLEVRAGRIVIATMEGAMWADPGDWIVKGVKGEFYPCRPDVFEQCYEPV